MNIYHASLINRGKQVITKATVLKQKRGVMVVRQQAGIAKRVQAMLARTGL